MSRALAAVAVAAFAALGCGPRGAPEWPSAAPAPDDGWRTMSAQHQVELRVHTDKGIERRSLRGLVAVERPNKFRLRALGPAGITLFDVLYVEGDVKVVSAIKDPSSPAMMEIVRSMAGDLAAAFDLEPRPPSRRVEIPGKRDANDRAMKSGGWIDDGERRVWLGGFVRVAGHVLPTSFSIIHSARHYEVAVQVVEMTVDEPLDPEMWKAP